MEQDTSRNFKFNNFGSELEIDVDEDNQAKCHKCGRKFKFLMQHIKKSKVCRENLDYENFKTEYESFANRRRQRAYRTKELELNPTKTRNDEATKNSKGKKVE